MKVLIVDDEALARDRLRRLVADLPDCEVVGEATDGASAVREAAHLQPDVILLDVRMPGMDGMEAARHMVGAELPPAIIFVTAYGDHALEAFETQAVDYVVKPVRAERLARAIATAVQPNRAQTGTMSTAVSRQQLCARLGNELQLVAVADVCYFRADQKYVTVRHTGGEVLLEESLRSLEEEFGDRFLRIHRKALVALAHVAGLTRTAAGRFAVRFHGIDDTLEVSRRHLPMVRERLRAGQ